jgi:peptidyl-prolyl cis-trans isomerase D
VFLPAKDQYEEEKETNPSLEFVPPVAPDFSKTAESLGLKLSETGLITLTEDRFQRSSLGQAVEMQAGRVRGRTVAEVIAPADFFQPHQLQNLANDEFFVAWKIDDKPEREPAFEEIRDRVLLAFRMSKARDQALERANQIAKLLRELNGDVNRLREKEGELESITIPPVALWSNAPMFSMQMMSRPGRVATELPGLHYPSDELRNATFELKEGEVTVAPNQPHDIYYVVLLNKRESASREDFARSRQFIEMQIQSEQQEKMYRDWLADLRREASGKLARVPAGN